MKLTMLSLNYSRENGMFLLEGDQAEQVMNRMIEIENGITWDSLDNEGATAIYNKFNITTKQLRDLYRECKLCILPNQN